MEQLTVIATSGFIVLAIYRIYFKTQFNEQNTYQTLFTSLIFGLLPYSFYQLSYLIPFPTDSIFKEFPILNSPSFHEVYKVIAASVSTMISAFLVCLFDIGKHIIAFREWLGNSNDIKMDLNMMIEREFHEFQRSFKKVFIQLKDGKVIVGMIKFADYSDSVPSDLRIVKIQVLKSGTRDNKDSKKITFNVHYDDLALDQLMIEQIALKGESWDSTYTEDELDNLHKNKINKFAPTYSLFLREIKYYSEFDQNIHDIFQGDSDEDSDLEKPPPKEEGITSEPAV